MMVRARNNGNSHRHDLSGDGWSDGRILFAIAIGSVAIIAALGLWAVANTRFEIGPGMPLVTYVLMAIAAIMLFGNYMLTLIRDHFRAGLYLTAFWLLTLLVLFSVFKFAE